MKVVAALSGGVDSAVAAARAVAAGHEVVGVHLALSKNPQTFRSGARGCCSLEDSRDARRVADVLGIPFYVWDFAEEFRSSVVDDFVAEYAAGRTPNPCLRCNESIKFSAVLNRAIALGLDAVCTGHYARVATVDGQPQLHRAVDERKDQSYVLAVMNGYQLAHAMFPLGDTTKAQVREEARQRGLLVADKRDSHDICFIANGDTSGFLREHLGTRPATIVDESGRVLAEHAVPPVFTVGQRRGLRLGRPGDDGEPRYVLSVEPVTSTVMVGARERLKVGRFVGSHVRWCGAAPQARFGCEVQVRAHGGVSLGVAAVSADDGSVEVRLHQPIAALAPGQSAVMYDATRVVGSVTVDHTWAWDG